MSDFFEKNNNFSKNKLIIPRKVSGFWELMPEQQILFSGLLQNIEDVFKANCFVPLDTPVLEYSEALLAKSGGETDKQVYRFCKGDSDLCLRYDLTVPLARFVAMHQGELNFPFKRYQIGKVYRGERPQKGRFREFYQCDADIIGNGELSLVADAECINLLEKCFKKLNLPVEIRISNRKIISGLIEIFANHFDEESDTAILITLDKAGKLPEDEILSELEQAGLSSENCKKLLEISKKSGKFAEILPFLRNFCQNFQNSTLRESLAELEQLHENLQSFGVENAILDLSIIRGHNYYTGTVFEAFLKNHAEAVGGGGRFENLCSYFSNQKMPGVGMSIGITRLFDILQKDGYFNGQHSGQTQLAIITFDDTLAHGLRLQTQLRQAGILAECLYENKTFKSKMKEADRREIRYALIVGSDEVASEKYTLKDMRNGTQENLSLSEIIERLKN